MPKNAKVYTFGILIIFQKVQKWLQYHRFLLETLFDILTGCLAAFITLYDEKIMK